MSRPNNVRQPVLRLLLLGSPALVDGENRSVAGMGAGKPLAMLAYLAVNGRAQREELVSLLWPEIPQDRARNAFRQTLHRVRAALDQRFLSSDRDVIILLSDSGLWCDVRAFRDAVANDVDHAVSLYRGPFLGGLSVGSAPFEHWAESERDRLEAQYRGALMRSVSARLKNGDTDLAVEHARTLAQIAPLDAQSAVLEATTLVAAGRKPEAVSALNQFSARLEAELGQRPPATVTALVHRLMNEAPAAAQPIATSTPDLLAEPEFVGREREIGKMLGLWRSVEQRGALVVLTGPPGIGKTRLLREFTQRLAAFGPALLLWGQERNGNRAIPYAAVADALRPAVHAPGVAGASQHLLAEAARLLPEIRDQFDLPRAGPLEDDAARIRFFEGVAALIDAVAFEQPVCMVLEDLQHASRSSAELVQFLAQRLAAAPVLFVVSYRPSQAPSYVLERFAGDESDGHDGAESVGSSHTRELIELVGLEDHVMKKLVSTAGAAPILDDETTAATIVAASQGNPFRALELVRRVRRGERVADLPVDVAATLWARLQACSPHEQRLFLASALLGRAVPLRLLAAATHLAEPVVFDAALLLEQRGLIVQRSGGVAPAHDVVAVLALEGSGSAGRALLAGWTADALAAEPGASSAELAQLYAAAGQPSSAHRYARAAVLGAAANGAEEELDNLLSLAAQTASNIGDRQAVESLRTAFGGGLRRLRSGSSEAGAPAPEGATSDRDDATDGHGAPDAAKVAPPAAGRTTAEWSSRFARIAKRRPTQVAAILAIGAAVAAAQYGTQGSGRARGTMLEDSVVVSQRLDARKTRRFLVTGPLIPRPAMSEGVPVAGPPWLAEISLPWVNPQLSPDGRYVAAERITPAGTDIHLISANQRDTVPLATRPGDDLIAGWSPDSRWVLVIHEATEDTGPSSGLHAYSADQRGVTIALDTVSRAVLDAAWSPTGMHVAWTARTGATRQQDVFVGMGDGSDGRNVTDNPTEDYRPAWSPDGQRLIFTSDRTGDAELYDVELATNALRRLTFNPAQDDRAMFSPDGSFIAFESTRGGSVGVYVMPPAGGMARKLTPADTDFELLGWRGRAPGFVATLRAIAPATMSVGARAELAAHAVDQYGSPLSTPAVEWESLDGTADLVASPSREGVGSSTAALVARRAGIARVVAKAGRWRADTSFTLIGTPLTLLTDGFDDGLSASTWAALGDPRPVAENRGDGSRVLVLRSDRRWESGVLGKTVFPLRPGLSLSVRVRAPFGSPGHPGDFTLALVAAEPEDIIDQLAPQFLKLAAISWLPDAQRLAYSAGREFWSEPVRFARGDDWYDFRIEVESDGRIAFYIEDRLRRRSTVVVAGRDEDVRVQLWLGGRRTADDVWLDDVQVRFGKTR